MHTHAEPSLLWLIVVCRAWLPGVGQLVWLSLHPPPPPSYCQLLHQCALHLRCWTLCIHNASMWGGRRWSWEWYLFVTVDDILCLQLVTGCYLAVCCRGPVEWRVLQGGGAAERDHPLWFFPVLFMWVTLLQFTSQPCSSQVIIPHTHTHTHTHTPPLPTPW